MAWPLAPRALAGLSDLPGLSGFSDSQSLFRLPALVAGEPSAWLQWLSLLVLSLLLARSSTVGQALWRGWLATLGVSLAALVGSVMFGLLFLFGQRSSLPVVRWVCRGLLEFVRDTPLLVHLLFGYFVIFAPLLSRPLSNAGFDDKWIIGVFRN